jgi:hypothetical protein
LDRNSLHKALSIRYINGTKPDDNDVILVKSLPTF